MLDLYIDRRHNVVLVRLSGRVITDDLDRLDVTARQLVARQGPSRALVDFTNVDVFDIDLPAFVQRGQRAAIMTDQDRVYVTPRPDLFGLGRMFSTYQKIGGNREPLVVRTLDEAYRALELVDPEFEPLPLAESP